MNHTSLSADDILAIHYELVKQFEAENDPIIPAGPRDLNLVHSASMRPYISLGGIEKYESVIQKAAALFHSLAMNHAFHNGNKRTALVSLLVFLDRHKIRCDAEDDELFEFVIAVADNRFVSPNSLRNVDEVVERIENWIGNHTSKGNKRPSDMRVQDFLEKCQLAGCRVRKQGSGGSWLVFGPNSVSVKISKSTPRLTGAVVRRYLQKIELSPAQLGIYMDEFQDGLTSEQAQIRRFRNVLKRLAHA